MADKVINFRPYPLEPGDKIRIDGSPRGGDWLVLDVTDRKMKLKCPVSGVEVEWDRFCALSEIGVDQEWPKKD